MKKSRLALRRQNRILIWIDGHIPSRVIEFFPTDWMRGRRISQERVSGTVKLSRILGFWSRNRSSVERIINNLGSVQDAE